MRRSVLLLAALIAVVVAAGVALAATRGGDEPDLTVYSGRNEQLVGPLFDAFERESGLQVDVRYGDSAELAATLGEEGDGSPADVFFSQDAGALGSVEPRLRALPRDLAAAVPARFRDPGGRWTGVSGRARVIAYGTERFSSEREVPDSVFELTRPRWRGKVGLPPTNASFQAFVSAMRLSVGDDRTRAWLEAMRRNDVRTYENNIQTVEAIGRGEIELGLVNHYYLYELKRETPDLAVANAFPRAGDPGSLINVSGVGILRTSRRVEAAERFARFLLARPGQQYFADRTSEYPLIAGVQRRGELPPLSEVEGLDITLGRLGGRLRSTLQLLGETGYTS